MDISQRFSLESEIETGGEIGVQVGVAFKYDVISA
jgi:hypothetical protein